MAHNTILKILNISKRFGDKYALRNISLNIYEREIFCLIGPSGAGKTTLLRLINMLETPNSGKIFFRDIELTSLKENKKIEIRRKMSLVFQKPVLFNTTVFNNVAYGLFIRKIEPKIIKEKVREVLSLVGLSEFEKKNALKLSGGEAQRVALARSIVVDPEILLLDEPTANLDPANVAIVEEIISKIQRENKTTVIMATHNMHQARRLAHRVAFLLNGELIEVGVTEEIFEKPKCKEKAVNFLELLSGETHSVYTGISIVYKNFILQDFEKTRVTFKILTKNEIEEYIATSEPFDKAGAYGIQGYGSQFIEKINGCYFNVMGFPVNNFYNLLKQIEGK